MRKEFSGGGRPQRKWIKENYARIKLWSLDNIIREMRREGLYSPRSNESDIVRAVQKYLSAAGEVE